MMNCEQVMKAAGDFVDRRLRLRERLTILAHLAMCLHLGAAILLAASVLPRTTQAGAWTREAGGWFFKLGYDRSFAGERFDSSGARVPYRDIGPPTFTQGYRSHALRAYVEYGLTSKWTAAVSGGYEWLASKGDGAMQKNSGLSDVRLGLKRRLLASPVVASLAAEIKLPLAARNGRAPALGSDQIDVSQRLALGGAVGSFYASGEAGYRVRGGALADEIPFEAELGWSLLRDVMVRATLRGTSSVGEGRMRATPFDPALADSRDLVGGAGLVLRGSPFDLVFEAERVLQGRNALAGTRLGFSVWNTRPGRNLRRPP